MICAAALLLTGLTLAVCLRLVPGYGLNLQLIVAGPFGPNAGALRAASGLTQAKLVALSLAMLLGARAARLRRAG